jgi:hypothetical protein
MGWVHSRKHYGACLALAALALQLIVSFGHVHLDGVVRGSPAVAAAGTSGKSTLQASRQAPAQNPVDDADGYCAICASIFLASTTFIPPVPQLPVPVGFERIAHSFSVAFGITAPRRVAFQSRAPPAA